MTEYDKLKTIHDKIEALTKLEMEKENTKPNNLILQEQKILTKIQPMNNNLFELYHIIVSEPFSNQTLMI